jgi:molybdopterin-synthase adenylyltransferase
MTIKLEDTLIRQMDLIPMEALGKRITIVGAGAVGSWVALSLVKMGFSNVTVWDHDKIDVENMNCQFYPVAEIGQPKVMALHRMIKMFTNIDITPMEMKWDKSFELKDEIIIAAVDSMAVRKEIFESCKHPEIFIDPRMGAETMLLYTFNPNEPKDVEGYNASWYSDDDAKFEKCTAKSTIYCANILAGIVCKTVKNIAVGQTYSRVLQWNLNGAVSPAAGFECWLSK